MVEPGKNNATRALKHTRLIGKVNALPGNLESEIVRLQDC